MVSGWVIFCAIRGGRRRAGPGYVRLPSGNSRCPLRSLFTEAIAKGREQPGPDGPVGIT